MHFSFHDDDENPNIPHEKFLPFAASELYTRKISETKILAEGPKVKKICELTLDLNNIDFDFKPGDAIGVLPENDPSEVEAVISKLEWRNFAEKGYTLSIGENKTGKKATIPKHLPQTGTIQELFKRHVDIRSIPKKLFLKGLLQFTGEEEDRQKLEKLTDSKAYESFVSNEGRTLLKLLNHLPSCKPSEAFLFQHLPALQPRYYSIASSPRFKNALKIVFSLTVNADGSKGVCTGFLENAREVRFYFRKSSEFLKFDGGSSAILIGAGTGVAPFIGYLQDVAFQQDANNQTDSNKAKTNNAAIEGANLEIKRKDADAILDIASININAGVERGLYFGCRYPDEDHIYKEQLAHFLDIGALDWLSAAFSRAENLHVQDKLKSDGAKIVDCILTKNAVVCVCGDGKTLGESIGNLVVELLVDFGGKTSQEAVEYFAGMKKEGRFQLDIWS